jgi:hypothetical protein
MNDGGQLCLSLQGLGVECREWQLTKALNAGRMGGDKIALLTGVPAAALSDVSETFLKGVCQRG